MAGRVRRWALPLLLVPAVVSGQATAGDSAAAVRAVLFYSPTCPHCQDVMSQDLPPILDRYEGRLQVIGVNTASPGGEQLYRAAIESLAIPRDRVGVPTLIVGSRALVGGYEIPTLLPALVDEGLADGGIDWPQVPLLRRALAAQGLLTSEVEGTPGTETERATPEAAEEVASTEPSRGSGVDDTAPDTGSESEAEGAAGGEGAVGVGEEEAGAAAEAEGDAETGGEPPAAQSEEPPSDTAAPTAGENEPSERAPAAGSEPRRSEVDDGQGTTEPGASVDTSQADSLLAGSIARDTRAALAHELSVRDRVMLDPAGNGAAIAVLILMGMALGLVVADLGGRIRIPMPPGWAIPALTVVGIGVAAYLAFIEVTGTEAVCGPVGDCNTVQQSRFARVLGVPLGLVGVAGYGMLLAGWALGRLGSERVRSWARRGTWWLALGATGFSIYLTFLEPFVIGASCAWCLTSALTTTLILVAASPGYRMARGVGSGTPAGVPVTEGYG